MEHSNSSEQQRLQALRHLDILNTPREQRFDDLTHIASQLLSVPITLISLVDESVQWFKSCVGLAVDGTARDISFCTHAIMQEDLENVFVVRDATEDPIFRNNPLVTGPPHIRFYAGAPMVTRDGHAVGTLCAIDTVPRDPTPQQLQTLRVLARTAVTQMELRATAEDLIESERCTRLIIETALDAVITVDNKQQVTGWNPQAVELLGISTEAAIGRSLSEVMPGEADDYAHRQTLDSLLANKVPNCAGRHSELTLRRANATTFPAEVSVSNWHTRGRQMSSIFLRDLSIRKMEESERQEAETRDVVIYAMARLAESRDPETGAHIDRVQTYCRALAEQLAKEGPYQTMCDPEFIRLMYTTSSLHDIGKVGIPDDILLKPGRLSDREFEIMKNHTIIGAETLDSAIARFPKTRFLQMARNIAASHHERFDGSGYPTGLRGTQIPLCGRIVALADVYDALTSRRVYKAAFTHDVARNIIYKDSGKHFDPVVVDAFRAIERSFEAIYQQSCLEPALAA